MVNKNLTIVYMNKLKDLSEGVISPEEASVWATNEMLRLESAGEVISPQQDELLDNLMLAGTLNGTNALLYTRKDFISWIKDWNNKYPNILT